MDALLSLLKNIQQHSQQLLDCLKHEKQLLDSNQLDTLNDVSSQKQQLLIKLDQLDKQRSANTPKSDFNLFITNTHNSTLIKQWDISRRAIAACQKQNEINGRIISRHSHLNQDVLSILTGRDQPADETYNSQGNQTRKSSLLNEIKV
ncbi:hypothetical protein MNBD_GAMMA07-2614 [hydrothermal vent metagenome]|uniref:Flagellar biosynthesis protein FlgN n=1 Tax=hydrothermal vent metagenome TaxID=652676 RepID=A0A3B0WQD6_9ZZZZ